MPLKGIPFILSPELLFTLSSAGHGDEIVLADAHFPTSSICRHGPKEIRADGHMIPELLAAILKVFPLDPYVTAPVALMELVDVDKKAGLKVKAWPEYQRIVNEAEGKQIAIEKEERFAFYDRAKKSFAVVHTGDTAQYGNIILVKGLVLDGQ